MPRRGLAIEELFEEFETPHSSLMAATASAIASSSGRSAHDHLLLKSDRARVVKPVSRTFGALLTDAEPGRPRSTATPLLVLDEVGYI